MDTWKIKQLQLTPFNANAINFQIDGKHAAVSGNGMKTRDKICNFSIDFTIFVTKKM